MSSRRRRRAWGRRRRWLPLCMQLRSRWARRRWMQQCWIDFVCASDDRPSDGCRASCGAQASEGRQRARGRERGRLRLARAGVGGVRGAVVGRREQWSEREHRVMFGRVCVSPLWLASPVVCCVVGAHSLGAERLHTRDIGRTVTAEPADDRTGEQRTTRTREQQGTQRTNKQKCIIRPRNGHTMADAVARRRGKRAGAAPAPARRRSPP